METISQIQTRHLEHLFDAELWYRSDTDIVVPVGDREGELIGSGEGTITGEKIRGTIHWSFFAANCAYLLVRSGIEPPPGQHLCRTNPGGIIETDDGARIWFDARGYGLRGYNPAQPHKWHLTMALQFHTNDQRYRWLNTTLGVWEGEFNEEAGRASYRAYRQRGWQEAR
ncbi:MAG: DUF3237 domain-containing protein [Ardenticatenaceae bacterium]|nr:DUF3237 domain-containing protein [Ardenticatenaceae bacterium]HBY95446.1 hypothetical protein [Chloroflexota bacterium]